LSDTFPVCAQRGYFHFHACITTVLSPTILAAVAHSKVFSNVVANIYDKMIKAELPLKYHVEGAARDLYPKRLKPVSHNVSAVIPPLPTDKTYLDHVHSCVAQKNVHSWKHTDACVRPGCPTCRMAKGSGFCNDTGSYLVTVKMVEGEKHFSLTVEDVPELTHDNKDRDASGGLKHCSIPPIDPRPITFELRRRKLDLESKDNAQFPPGAAPNLLYWLDCADLSNLDKEVRDVLEGIESHEQSLGDDAASQSMDVSLATFKHFVQKRNSMVTEYSEPLMAATASNQALYPIGTGHSAKTAQM